MSVVDNLTKQDPMKLALAAVVLVGFVYLLTRKTVEDAADGVAGLVTGDNAITRSATNASGEPVSAYEGAGVLGTLGAAVNHASGGVFASWGEALGRWTFETFGPKPEEAKAMTVEDRVHVQDYELFDE